MTFPGKAAGSKNPRHNASSFRNDNFAFGNKDIIEVTADMNKQQLTFKINGNTLKEYENPNSTFAIHLKGSRARRQWYPALSVSAIHSTDISGHIEFLHYF